MFLVELLISFICTTGGNCVSHTITVTREATAVAACESGDTVTLGSVNWDAVGYNGTWSTDGGAWQFNDYWIWNPDMTWAIDKVAPKLGLTTNEFIERYPTAQSAPPHVQYEMFKLIWDDGYGYQNWSASQKCWSKWLTVENGRAIWRENGRTFGKK